MDVLEEGGGRLERLWGETPAAQTMEWGEEKTGRAARHPQDAQSSSRTRVGLGYGTKNRAGLAVVRVWGRRRHDGGPVVVGDRGVKGPMMGADGAGWRESEGGLDAGTWDDRVLPDGAR